DLGVSLGGLAGAHHKHVFTNMFDYKHWFVSPCEVEVNHHQEIKYSSRFEDVFKIYSSSPSCKIHVIKHLMRPLYGVQFHPETMKSLVAQKQGAELLRNFVSLL
ncbi:MAG: glutamine amidotransferase-related protein, partial [Promethearchaeota archaeon]